MSEKQKQLVEDILAASEKLPPEKQYQLLGVAQGLGMVPGPKQAGENPVRMPVPVDRDGKEE